MNCSNCGSDNPSGAKFCLNCGHALEIACPNCATGLPVDAKFCMNCGHQLEAGSTAGMEGHTTRSATDRLAQEIAAAATSMGERRVITMLFVDVIGSTAAAEKLGPERWSAIMRGAFDRFIAPVERYEGSVARMLGDAILAYFGAPVAHEDDPQRAALAALEMMAAVRDVSTEFEAEHGFTLECRIGINTGLVVVGEVGSEMYGEYAALGDAANVAARMEQTAEPGTIQVAEATHRLIEPVFEFEAVGELEVKGKTDGIAAYRLVGAKAEPGRLRGIKGLESPIVGRDAEKLTLSTAVKDLEAGRGQIVSLIAEAGLGKSRLASELKAECHVLDRPLRWVEGASFSYDTKTPFAPVISIIAQCLGVTGLDPDHKYPRISEVVTGHGGPDVQQDTALLARLIGVDPDAHDEQAITHLMPPQVRELTIDAVVRHLEHTAGDGPLVVMFEDLHWADAASIEVVTKLLPATNRVPLMVLSVFRPRRHEAAWEVHELADREFPHRYTSVRLRPLTDDHSRELVANLLRVDGLAPAVRESILEKAEGNPFFVEEVIRSLLDDGTIIAEGDTFVTTRELTSIAVPDSLAAVIATRLDQLGPETKRLIQAASVVGRDFDEDVVEVLGGAGVDIAAVLSDLQRRELIIQTASAPSRIYSFKHALTMDTAYDSLLESVRLDLHRVVGKVIEERYPDRVVQIADHFLKGDEQLAAVPYLVRAGNKMSYAFSMGDAVEYYEQAIALAGDDADTQVCRDAYEGLATAHMFMGEFDEAMTTYERMRQFGEQRDDAPTLVSSMNKEAFARYFMSGETEVGGKLVEDALSLAEEAGDLAGQAECHATYCGVKLMEGDVQAATDHLLEMKQIGVSIGSLHHRLFAMAHSGMTMSMAARYDEADAALSEAMDEARKHGVKHVEAEIMAMIRPYYHAGIGELEAGRQAAVEGAAMAREINDPVHIAWGEVSAAIISRMLGDYTDALSRVEEPASIGAALGHSGIPQGARTIEAVILYEIEGADSEAAAAAAAKADAALDTATGGVLQSLTMAERAHACLVMGDVDDAERFIELGNQHLGSTAILARPSLMLCTAAIALVRGDLDGLRAAVDEADAFLADHPVAWSQPKLIGATGCLALLDGDAAQAADLFGEAVRGATALGILPDLAGMHDTFAMVYDRVGDASTAAEHRRASARVKRQIADRMSDADTRASYLSTQGIA